MNLIEIEARKAMLVREILTQVDDEKILNKLVRYFHKTIKGTDTYPLSASVEENKASAIASAADKQSYAHEDVMAEMENLINSWK